MNTPQRGSVPDRLIEAGNLTAERMPMLNVVFDRFAGNFAEGLRQLASTAPYISVGTIRNDRIGDVLDGYESTAVVGVFYSPEWDTRILVGFDRDFMFCMVDVLFGADGTEPPTEDDRTFSNLELRLSRLLFGEASVALSSAFSSLERTSFKVERIETRMDFAMLGRRTNPAVVASLLLQALGRGGEIFVVIPQTALNPLRHSLSKTNAGEASAGDPKWARKLESEIQRSHVLLQAILDEKSMTLDEIAAFKVGQVIELNATPRTPVRLDCRKKPLFHCSLGQTDGLYTLQVEDFADPEGFNARDLMQS